jgi:hypothetical protein
MTDSEKLDKILKKLEWMTGAIQGLGIAMNNLAGALREKTSPVPPPASRKQP